ncbi:MAG: class I SAM-dependent methyltransferase [Gemmatimonadales bacterium]|nr:MAG: class I SAM-dependent methyltransferase [Gemmatimonadales bacterium]
MSAPAPPPERDALVPWYRSWFGEEYLHLYPHRDQEEADQAVALLLRELEDPRTGGCGGAGGRVLDLGCGAGRHLKALAEAGLRPVGMDLSLPLLREARRTAPGCLRVRGDMRHLPFEEGSFDLVTSFFTSFGYFEADSEDRKVLAEMDRVLGPGGRVFLDFLNAERVRATLEPRDERIVDGKRVVQLRRLVDGGRRVEKRIRIRGKGVEEDFVERVRLYDAAELEALLGTVGLEVEARFGDYGGGPPGPAAPREILLARRAT